MLPWAATHADSPTSDGQWAAWAGSTPLAALSPLGCLRTQYVPLKGRRESTSSTSEGLSSVQRGAAGLVCGQEGATGQSEQ